jgi:hypothetical protein
VDAAAAQQVRIDHFPALAARTDSLVQVLKP